jgi:ankyrin repeat protein
MIEFRKVNDAEPALAQSPMVRGLQRTFTYIAEHGAAKAGNVAKVQELLAAGAAVDARGRWYGIPLHGAAREGHADATKLLLTAGAKVDARNNNGSTPLHYAANSAVAKVLLDAGADVNVRNRNIFFDSLRSSVACAGSRAARVCGYPQEIPQT